MKILYVTTIGITMIFFKDLVRSLLDEGHTVDIVCNETDEAVPVCYREWGCKVYAHSCSRSPFAKGNLTAIKQIKKIVEENHYDIVHCHTPIASICTRLACRKLRKKGVKVIYTAHGFHFYKGAPLVNWLLYYPIEKLCARFTDTLITINKEDYELAKHKMKAKRVEYVPGVGIDVDKFKNTVVDRAAKRKELGIPEDAFLLISVGELNKNKNHEVVIRALAQLNNPKIHYAIAGVGSLKEYLEGLAKELGVAERVHLLGYRKDVAEIYKAADVCCFPSIREGLGLAAIEGMASGLPVIAADNRGTREFMENEAKSFMCKYDDINAFADSIDKLAKDIALRERLAERAMLTADKFDVGIVLKAMNEVYERV